MHHPSVDPSAILQVGMAFFASKTLLSAVELGVFTHLAAGPLGGAAIAEKIGLHPRSHADFLDALVALGFLAREGDGPSARYANTPATAAFLDRASPTYIGGILEMANARLYPFWGDLTTALKTGEPQNEIKAAAKNGDLFGGLYADPAKLEQFVAAMAGVQMGNFMALAATYDFSRHEAFCDLGGSSGALAIQVARRHPKLACTTYDLPAVAPIATRTIAKAGLEGRVTVASGDFFVDPYPKADVIAMCNILHDWGLDEKKRLIGRVYDALPPGGVFIAVENVIDDARRANAFGLLMSLNMLIETRGGFDYTGGDFDAWCRAAGFTSTKIVPLAGPASAAIAFK